MLKIILKNIKEKPLHLMPFWQYVKAKQKIRDLSREIKTIEDNLKNRSDQEFLAYSMRKLLVITKTQNQLLLKKY